MPAAACQQTKTSLFLRPGAEFKGKQVTDQKTHEVRIEIKDVNLQDDFVCGYLEITKITDTIPSMTTYFEGELIGSKHKFETKHRDWGASKESDRLHWERFPFFKRLDETIEDPTANPVVFMRWKERFLVPDQQRELEGASFSGFYYVCLDQTMGRIYGFYFQRGQAARERYQSIELDYTWSKCYPEYEFI